MSERNDSWLQIFVPILWIVAIVWIVGFFYVVIHFIRKFW